MLVLLMMMQRFQMLCLSHCLMQCFEVDWQVQRFQLRQEQWQQQLLEELLFVGLH